MRRQARERGSPAIRAPLAWYEIVERSIRQTSTRSAAQKRDGTVGRALGSSGTVQSAARPEKLQCTEQQDGADDGYDEAPEVQPGDPSRAELMEEEPADKGANDADDDIDDDPFASLIYDFAADESRDESEHEPRND